MKALSAPVLAALAGGSVAIATLISLDFAVPIYLNTSTWDLTWQRRYNLLTNSQQFDLWVDNGGLPVTANAMLAPDGTMTADTTVNTGFTRYRYSAGSLQSGSVYTYSFYVKPADPAGAINLYADASAGYSYATVYPNTGGTSGVGGGATSAGVIGVGAGWYRVWMTFAPPSTGAQALHIIPASVDLHGWWGAQLELGDIATNYTPTITTAFTDPGVVYKGAYGLGTISAVQDKPGEISGITLELAAGSPAIIALALDGADEVQGTVCTIRTAIIDTTTYTILDAPIEWVGKLDTMAIAEDGASATIAVTAESGAVDLLRGNAWTFTDADQRIVNAADASFSYVLDQIDKPIIWPTKAFFYK